MKKQKKELPQIRTQKTKTSESTQRMNERMLSSLSKSKKKLEQSNQSTMRSTTSKSKRNKSDIKLSESNLGGGQSPDVSEERSMRRSDVQQDRTNNNQLQSSDTVKVEEKKPPEIRARKEIRKLQKYDSHSMDDQQFADYFDNPLKRKEYDKKRLQEQMRDLQNTAGLNIAMYGAKALNLMPGIEEEEVPKHQNEKNFATVSLFCLSTTNPFRNQVIKIVAINPWFDRLILLVILCNCIFLAMDNEVDYITQNTDRIDQIFLIIYTCEMMLKIIAYGFIMQAHTYLRDSWNVLDFLVVIAGWISVQFADQNISAIRVIRILRPLRTINSMPGMSSLVNTILNSLPSMFDIMVLFCFTLIMFGTIATQLLGGQFQNRCFIFEDNNDLNSKILLKDQDGEEIFCMDDEKCQLIKQSSKCLYYGNPIEGTFQFNNILYSMFNIFQIITLEGWTEMMFIVRQSQQSNVFDTLFILCVVIGAFFVLNLMIAVQFTYLGEAFDEESIKKKIIEDQIDQKKQDKINQEQEDSFFEADDEDIDISDQCKSEEEVDVSDENDSRSDGSSDDSNSSKGGESTSQLENNRRKKGCCSKYCKNCCKFYDEKREIVEKVMESIFMQKFVMVLIMLNSFVLASEHYEQDQFSIEIGEYANLIFTVLFALEMVFKQIGLGFNKYIQDGFNIFDCIIVLVSLLELAIPGEGSGLSVLRAFRLLRIFKIIKSWQNLRILFSTVLLSLMSITNLGVLTMLYLFIASLLGKQFFPGNLYDEDGEVSRYNFSTTVSSFITIFVILTGEEWNQIMIQAIEQQQAITLPALFFMFNVLIGHYMLLNLFLAILLKFITENTNEKKEEQMKLEIDQMNQEYLKEMKSQKEKEENNKSKENSESVDIDHLGQQIFSQGQEENNHQEEYDKIVQKLTKQFTTRFLRQKIQKNERIKKQDKSDSQSMSSFSEEEGDDEVVNSSQEQSEFQSTENEGSGHDIYKEGGDKKDKKSKKSKKKSSKDKEKKFGQERQERKSSEKKKDKSQEQRQNEEQATGRSHDQTVVNRLTQSIDQNSLDIIHINSSQERQESDQFKPSIKVQPKIIRKKSITLDIKSKSLFVFASNNRFRLFLKQMVQNKYFDNFIYHMIALNSLLLALVTPELKDYYEKETLQLLLSIITIIFILEASIKIIVMGFYLSKNAYLKDSWNKLDFIIVCASIINWLLEYFVQKDIKFVRAFRALRGLRPLRVVSMNEGIKTIVNSLIQSIPSLLNVLLIILLFLVVFGILGVQQFKGMLGMCNDISVEIQTKQQCVGTYMIPKNDAKGNHIKGEMQEVKREWIVNPNNYDNIFSSILTFFEISTLEAWPSRMFEAIDGVAIDHVPKLNNNPAVATIYILFIFLTTFFIMNLFISVIVDKFNQQIKMRQGADNFTKEQKEWVKIQRLLLIISPKQIPVQPKNCFRYGCFQIVQSKIFEYSIMLAIVINTVFLMIDYYGINITLQNILNNSNKAFVGIFAMECTLKIIAYGWKYYWHVNWNKFDFFIVLISLVGLDEDALQQINFNPTALRIIRVTRLLRMIKTSQGLRNMLKTLYMSLGNILTTGCLLVLIIFTFSIAGMNMFGQLEEGNFITKNNNFKSFYISMMTLWGASTGENWNGMLHECYQQEGFLAIVFWIVFELITFFIFMNVFIAVIYESFNENQTKEDENDVTTLQKKDLKAFQNTWAKFNPMGDEYMRTIRLPDFLRELPPPLGYHGIKIEDTRLNQVILSLNIKDHIGLVYYPEVMWPVFHSLVGVNDDKINKCVQMKSVLATVKQKYKGLPKKVTLDILCGNKYYHGEDQITASQYIQALKILTKWRAVRDVKNNKKKKQLQIMKEHEKLKREAEAAKRDQERAKKKAQAKEKQKAAKQSDKSSEESQKDQSSVSNSSDSISEQNDKASPFKLMNKSIEVCDDSPHFIKEDLKKKANSRFTELHAIHIVASNSSESFKSQEKKQKTRQKNSLKKSVEKLKEKEKLTESGKPKRKSKSSSASKNQDLPASDNQTLTQKLKKALKDKDELKDKGFELNQSKKQYSRSKTSGNDFSTRKLSKKKSSIKRISNSQQELSNSDDSVDDSDSPNDQALSSTQTKSDLKKNQLKKKELRPKSLKKTQKQQAKVSQNEAKNKQQKIEKRMSPEDFTSFKNNNNKKRTNEESAGSAKKQREGEEF